MYKDEQAGDFISDLVLNSDRAGHTLTLHKTHSFNPADKKEQVDAKCEVTGTLAYQVCSECHCKFDANEGKTLYREQDIVIPALGHHYVYDYYKVMAEGAMSTCTKEGGGIEYFCDNPGCTAETIHIPMAAIGHSYMLDENFGDGRGFTIDYDDGAATVKVYLKCQGVSCWEPLEYCDHTATVEMKFDCEVHMDATCTEAESFYYDFVIDRDMLRANMIAQDTEDEIEDGEPPFTLTVRQTIEGHEATGHVMEKVEAVPETCLAYGSTEGEMCSVCGHVEGVESVLPHGHKMEYMPALAPTCTAAGHGEGEVCVYCGTEAEGVGHFEPLGHDFSVDIAEELPGCTKIGHTAGTKCSRCDAVEGCDVVDDLGHIEEVIPGKAPSETESGLTEGLRCSRCGEILKEQEVIPALSGGEPSEGGDSSPEPANPDAMMWIIIGASAAVAAVAAVAVILIFRKKKTE